MNTSWPSAVIAVGDDRRQVAKSVPSTMYRSACPILNDLDGWRSATCISASPDCHRAQSPLPFPSSCKRSFLDPSSQGPGWEDATQGESAKLKRLSMRGVAPLRHDSFEPRACQRTHRHIAHSVRVDAIVGQRRLERASAVGQHSVVVDEDDTLAFCIVSEPRVNSDYIFSWRHAGTPRDARGGWDRGKHDLDVVTLCLLDH